jgi:hypothetical protein
MQRVSGAVDSALTDEHGSAASSVNINCVGPAVTIDHIEHTFYHGARL